MTEWQDIQALSPRLYSRSSFSYCDFTHKPFVIASGNWHFEITHKLWKYIYIKLYLEHWNLDETQPLTQTQTKRIMCVKLAWWYSRNPWKSRASRMRPICKGRLTKPIRYLPTTLTTSFDVIMKARVCILAMKEWRNASHCNKTIRCYSVQVEKLRPSLCKSPTASTMLNQNLGPTLSYSL